MTKKLFFLMTLLLVFSALAFAQGAQGTPANKSDRSHVVL